MKTYNTQGRIHKKLTRDRIMRNDKEEIEDEGEEIKKEKCGIPNSTSKTIRVFNVTATDRKDSLANQVIQDKFALQPFSCQESQGLQHTYDTID